MNLAREKADALVSEKTAAARQEAEDILKKAKSRMDQAARTIVEGIVDRI